MCVHIHSISYTLYYVYAPNTPGRRARQIKKETRVQYVCVRTARDRIIN